MLVVDDFFVQRLSDRLHNAAVNLAVDQHRIDHFAAIVDRDIFEELDVAGLFIDFDDADVSAERKGEILWLEEVRR